MKNNKMKFKKGDRVYVHPNGWGNVVKKEGDFIKINFYNGNTYICDVCLVSFTEYDLSGFSQERPDLEVGKSYQGIGCPDQFIINRKGDQENYGFVEGNFRTRMICSTPELWQEISKSEAIELLEKECINWGGENWKDVKIKECMFLEHDIRTNIGNYIINIGISEIWNHNGCIFKNGVWAEKLEEPSIKEGQRIWVKDAGDPEWYYRPYVEMFEDRTVCDNLLGCENRWDEHSILNPYSDSIESRAIQLLREWKAVASIGDLSVPQIQRNEFLKEIDSYANNPE